MEFERPKKLFTKSKSVHALDGYICSLEKRKDMASIIFQKSLNAFAFAVEAISIPRLALLAW